MSLDILACLSPKVYFVAFIPLAEKKQRKNEHISHPSVCLKKKCHKICQFEV